MEQLSLSEPAEEHPNVSHDIRAAKWGFSLDPTDYPPECPTRENSPTRYKQYMRDSSCQDRPSRAKRGKSPTGSGSGRSEHGTSYLKVSQNKYLDSDGDMIFPSLKEVFDMTAEDDEEYQRALQASLRK
ncbi:hypothetical protein QBC46DRAFT_152618 [Diplogelasinospora grovesii]|uniref:Uncharacterized protein n=1 Tax=Diplogelasinospora grovesii TaxID=303347 RepID=A0AAN6N527_9PEZI|nr:hypothetical protein QBC46DRAFT_152618 [Diplogelasinospora grovesii]